MEDYLFRTATLDDIDGIVALWPEHWEEVHYKDRGLEPNEPAYREWLKLVIETAFMPFIVALHGDEIVGFINYSLDKNFSTKPCAVMDKFFVQKAHRRSAVAAVLFAMALDLATNDGAAAFHAAITSETLAAKGLENMLTKLGFDNIGTIMGRAL